MNNTTQVTLERLFITPNVAKELLSLNNGNRRINASRVQNYARQMKEGLWKENPAEPISITKSNKLANGQHRLSAIVLANFSGFVYVIKNIDDDLFTVIDTGKNRNASDILQIEGIKNSTIVASIINQYYHFSKNRTQNRNSNDPLTNNEVLKIYLQEPKFWDDIHSMTRSFYTSFNKVITPSLIGAFLAYLIKAGKPNVVNFMDDLCSMRNTESNIIQLLRTKLIADKLSTRKLTTSVKVAIMIKAWNYYNSGKNVKFLKYDPCVEEYPTF
jgi:hypothetical protein